MVNRPNILIIQGDEHRFDCIGAYGNADVKTPHLDALAEAGVRYQESFCPLPVCTPSRYSFLTGLYVHQHLGWSNHCTIPAGMSTFPKVLREAGYKTKAVGKMHLTPTYADVGFDELVLSEQAGQGRYDDDYHRWLKDEGVYDKIDLMDQVGEYRSGAPQHYWDTVGAMESDLDEAHHSTTWIGDRAVETLEEWDGEGHLLMASFIKPHHPFDPPAPWSEMYDPNEISLLPGYTDACLPQDLAYSKGFFPYEDLTEEKIRLATAMYYGTISQIDHHVGRMVEVLKRKELYDNTLILYNSDHGDFVGFHHLLLKGNYMYDPVIKVPLIVKYPGQEDANTVCDRLVNTIDVGPTILKVAGCDVPDMAGEDLREVDRSLMFAETGRGNAYMVRSHTRKLLLCKNEDQSQFFDLEKDPQEMNNVIQDPVYGAEIQEFREALMRWALFDFPSKTHLDEAGSVIEGENVPDRDDGHREEMYQYFKSRMRS